MCSEVRAWPPEASPARVLHFRSQDTLSPGSPSWHPLSSSTVPPPLGLGETWSVTSLPPLLLASLVLHHLYSWLVGSSRHWALIPVSTAQPSTGPTKPTPRETVNRPGVPRTCGRHGCYFHKCAISFTGSEAVFFQDSNEACTQEAHTWLIRAPH